MLLLRTHRQRGGKHVSSGTSGHSEGDDSSGEGELKQWNRQLVPSMQGSITGFWEHAAAVIDICTWVLGAKSANQVAESFRFGFSNTKFENWAYGT